MKTLPGCHGNAGWGVCAHSLEEPGLINRNTKLTKWVHLSDDDELLYIQQESELPHVTSQSYLQTFQLHSTLNALKEALCCTSVRSP